MVNYMVIDIVVNGIVHLFSSTVGNETFMAQWITGVESGKVAYCYVIENYGIV